MDMSLMGEVFWGYTFGQIAVAIIIIAAVVAIVYTALRQFDIAIPPYLVKIIWICLAALVAVVAIKFLLSL